MTKIEIMGGNLDLAIKELEINATKLIDFHSEDYYINYQVWEMDRPELEKLNNCDNDEWIMEYGWYRIGEARTGITKTFIVNGKEMLGVYEENNMYETSYTDDDEPYYLEPNEKVHEFKNIARYYFDYVGISTEYNFVYFTTALAKLNNMKLSEFVAKYF